MAGSGRFEFLGELGELTDSSSWNDSGKSKLWLYNLHYLDDLNAVGAELRCDEHARLIERWIVENPPMVGVGWEPYPLSLRIVNLVKWLSRRNVDDRTWLNNLGLQAQALYKRPEYHLLGNHLFENGKALVFVGSFLEGAEADEWVDRGIRILDRQSPEQFLPDGGHFELSPMYHSILLWTMCDLVNLADRSGLAELKRRVSDWRRVIGRGLSWLETMVHPDGRIAFFNDASFGVAPEPEVIASYARSLGCQADPIGSETSHDGKSVSVKLLQNSGYCRVETMNGGVALLDMGRIGPDYLPAHGHADTLSFELSLWRQRVFVNSGTSQYREGAERLYERGSAAHNTLVINGENSSEVWSSFRVARRAYPTTPMIEFGTHSAAISASHNGYARLRSRNIHRRRWEFTESALTIRDEISGGDVSSEARFHVHPDVSVKPFSSGRTGCVLQLRSGQSVKFMAEGARGVDVVESEWHPQFGTSVPSQCIVVRLDGPKVVTRIAWGPET